MLCYHNVMIPATVCPIPPPPPEDGLVELVPVVYQQEVCSSCPSSCFCPGVFILHHRQGGCRPSLPLLPESPHLEGHIWQAEVQEEALWRQLRQLCGSGRLFGGCHAESGRPVPGWVLLLFPYKSGGPLISCFCSCKYFCFCSSSFTTKQVHVFNKAACTSGQINTLNLEYICSEYDWREISADQGQLWPLSHVTLSQHVKIPRWQFSFHAWLSFFFIYVLS